MAHSKSAPERSDQARYYATAAVSKAEKELPKGAIPVVQEKPPRAVLVALVVEVKRQYSPDKLPEVCLFRRTGKMYLSPPGAVRKKLIGQRSAPKKLSRKIAEIEVKKDSHEMSR